MNVIKRNNVEVFGEGRRVLLFAHGFGADQNCWRLVSREFLKDYRVVLFDHVGFGGSDRLAHTYERHGSLDGYAQDVLEVVDAFGPGPVTFVGHSIGGVLGLLASIDRPASFERLVLVNSSPHFIDEPPDYVGGFSRAQMNAVLGGMETDYVGWARNMAPLAIGADNDPALIRSFGQGLHSLDPMIARRFGRLVFFVDCRARLAQVSVPALIVQSTRDDFAPREVGRYLHAQLRGSTLLEIEASGHFPQLTSPEQLVAALRDQLGPA